MTDLTATREKIVRRILDFKDYLDTNGYDNIYVKPVNPGSDDDASQGYSLYDMVLNSSTDDIWQIIDTAVGAAVWHRTGYKITQIAVMTDSDAVNAVTSTSWVQDDGIYIGTDRIRARDGDGLVLTDADGNGILVKEGGDVELPHHLHTDRISVANVDAEIYLSTAQSIAGDDTWISINFDAMEHDDFNGFDSNNNEYIIQESGVYLLSGKAEADNIGQGNYLAYRTLINGSVISRHFTHAGAEQIISSSVLATEYLNEGDVVTSEAKQNSGSSVDLMTGEMATYVHLAKIG